MTHQASLYNGVLHGGRVDMGTGDIAVLANGELQHNRPLEIGGFSKLLLIAVSKSRHVSLYLKFDRMSAKLAF